MTAKKRTHDKSVRSIDIIRDQAIHDMADRAIADNAIVVGLIYETADNRIVMTCYPDAETVGDGLLRAACAFKGIEM